MSENKINSAEDFRTDYLLKQTIIVAIISFAVYGSMHVIVDFKGQLPVILNNYIIAMVFVAIYWIYKKGHHEIAKYLSIITIDLGFIVPVFICYGKTPALHYYFLVFAMAPLALWSLEKKQLTSIYFIINIAFFLFIERYSGVLNPILTFPKVLVAPVQISSMIMPFIILLSSLWAYYESIEKKNNEILEQKDKLADLNNELEEANATKDKFFSIIAHDLRNPLHTMMGFSDMLNTDSSKLNERDQKDYIHYINQSGKNLYNLLEDLLQWSSAQTNSISFNPKITEISTILTPIVSLLEPTAIKKKITIHNEMTPKLMVFADQSMITTIIQNLVTNALKFTPENGDIYLYTKEDKEFVRVSIVDNGVGISLQDQKRIFRIDNTHTRQGTSGEKGTGLGLNICQEFIKINGGTIGVESELGKGATFWFTLPKKVKT